VGTLKEKSSSPYEANPKAFVYQRRCQLVEIDAPAKSLFTERPRR
jgi:hypothetical protein